MAECRRHWSRVALGRQQRSGLSTPPLISVRRRLRERLLWAAVIVALLALLGWSNFRAPEPAPSLRSFLIPPTDTGFDFTGDFSGPPVISPDGAAVAFCARTPKERDSIWVRSLNELIAKKLDGTEGASFPFWSTDGRFVGFFTDGHLKKVSASGGPVTVLAAAPNARGGSWNQDNIIIFEPDYRDSLWRISAAGGLPVRELRQPLGEAVERHGLMGNGAFAQ